jgi:hypothetical protein
MSKIYTVFRKINLLLCTPLPKNPEYMPAINNMCSTPPPSFNNLPVSIEAEEAERIKQKSKTAKL